MKYLSVFSAMIIYCALCNAQIIDVSYNVEIIADTGLLDRACDRKCNEYKEFFQNFDQTSNNHSSEEYINAVAIGHLDKNGTFAFLCSGTLISQNFVLTAAHCASDVAPTTVRVGALTLHDTSSNVQIFAINNTIYHPNYNSSELYYNIALIELNDTVNFTSHIRPACLDAYEDYNDTSVFITGWGMTKKNSGKISESLQSIPVKILDINTCKLSYKNISALNRGIIEKQGCYEPIGDKDTCAGFSGAGAQVRFDNYEYLVGVSSFIYTCEGVVPRVYTKISAYIDWIESVLWSQYI